jgi:hypothetical protein
VLQPNSTWRVQVCFLVTRRSQTNVSSSQGTKIGRLRESKC